MPDNVLTGLEPTFYQAMDIVAKEQIGAIQSVKRDNTLERVAVGDPVKFPITPAGTVGDVTPSNVGPDDGNQTIAYDHMTITKSRRSPIQWNGEQTMSMGGYGLYNMILADQFAQSLRALRNEIETTLAADIIANASMAFGTSATTPFGTAGVLTDFANPKALLKASGSPLADLRMVLNSSSMINLEGKQSILFKANEAGTDQLLRDGIISRIQGFGIADSPEMDAHTAGTGALATTDATGYAVGAKTITLASAGTGTILAGDIFTIAGDDNKYVALTGSADVSAGGTITIGGSGLKVAITTAATAITLYASYTPNLFFPRDAVTLSTRMPALPKVNGVERDMAIDRMVVTDAFSGISYEISVYLGNRQLVYEVALAWGHKVTNSKYVGILQG